MAQPQPQPHPPSMPGNPGPPAGRPQLISQPPDPALQAVIDADFHPVDIALGPPNDCTVLCGPHKLEKCTQCGVDYAYLNRLSKLLAANPSLLCPPPANVVQQNLSKAINTIKEEGNAFYKLGQHEKAIGRYNQAASFAVQRAPWEDNRLMREELSTVLSNRSAAELESGDFIGALVDAESVIQIRRPWSKGHFRKAKALVALGQLEEAKDAVRLGLQFEPSNAELLVFLGDIERLAISAKNLKSTIRSNAAVAGTVTPSSSEPSLTPAVAPASAAS